MLDAVTRRLARLRGKTHAAVAVNVGEPHSHTKVVSVMSKEDTDGQKLTSEELEEHDGDPLPERTQMSVIRVGPEVGFDPVIDPVPPVD